MCQSKHNSVVYVMLLYYMNRATCFDSPESSSGPQGSDPGSEPCSCNIVILRIPHCCVRTDTFYTA
jgi:hypothetical protein